MLLPLSFQRIDDKITSRLRSGLVQSSGHQFVIRRPGAGGRDRGKWANG
ncbi:hypothetical protein [Moorena sp. SIO3A5]|nr:hypothetical protein [Moorena sp. SIO3A5]